MTRAVMWFLLAVVAAAAAVLSFSALRDLAVLCGFHEQLAWLLPVVVDAGAGAGSLVWLGTTSPPRALRFARSLALLLLASSVGGNAVVHGLSAYSLRPHWTLVVLVSAVAPSVLGAVIHLAVLVGRDVSMSDTNGQTPTVPAPAPIVGVSSPPAAVLEPEPSSVAVDPDSLLSRTEQLLPIGRRALAEQLGITEHQARELLRQAKALEHA